MAASTKARELPAEDRLFRIICGAKDELLGAMSADEEILLTGVVNTSASDRGFFGTTQASVHLTERKKTGVFKKCWVHGSIHRGSLGEVFIECPQFAPLRLLDSSGARPASGFEDMPGQRSAEAAGQRAAAVLGSR